MATSRLSLALRSGELPVPEGQILVFGATANADLSQLPKERLQIEQPFAPDHKSLIAQGYDAVVKIEHPGAMAIVIIPRAKALAKALLARAAELVPDGLLVVDGQKTDGIDSILKELKKRTPVLGSFSKAHGKLFWLQSLPLPEWRAELAVLDGGFTTAPGVFSADGVDPASVLLARKLPDTLKGTVADFGAGWGYLSSRILEQEKPSKVYLVEADHIALDCAKLNIADARAQFLWADATEVSLPEKVDNIVMNPPFHTNRKPDPDLGKRFIMAAARNLKASGQLFLVANRHLPYEDTLSACFTQVSELPGSSVFKILRASKPRR